MLRKVVLRIASRSFIAVLPIPISTSLYYFIEIRWQQWVSEKYKAIKFPHVLFVSWQPIFFCIIRYCNTNVLTNAIRQIWNRLTVNSCFVIHSRILFHCCWYLFEIDSLTWFSVKLEQPHNFIHARSILILKFSIGTKTTFVRKTILFWYTAKNMH